jgi:hypothetical protein
VDRESGSLHSDALADHPEAEQSGEQHESIVAAVQDSLNDLCGDLEETVRDQLKQELAEFRDSLDQISIDITWAVRQVRTTAYQPQRCDNSAPAHDTVQPDEPKPIHEMAKSHATDTGASPSRQSFLWQPE